MPRLRHGYLMRRNWEGSRSNPGSRSSGDDPNITLRIEWLHEKAGTMVVVPAVGASVKSVLHEAAADCTNHAENARAHQQQAARLGRRG